MVNGGGGDGGNGGDGGCWSLRVSCCGHDLMGVEAELEKTLRNMFFNAR